MAVLALVLLGVICARGRKNIACARRLATPLVLWAFWGSTAIYLVICIFKPILIARYLTLVAPFAAMFFALALMRLAPRWRHGLTVLFLIVFAAGYAGYHRAMPRADWRGVTQILAARMEARDVAVAENITARSCLIDYLSMLGQPKLMRNVITFDQLAAAFGGVRYPFPDRVLWFVDSFPARQQAQFAALKSANRLMGVTQLEAGFALARFRGREVDAKESRSQEKKQGS